MGSDWICEVLADLEMFARANELEEDLVNAVATAALIAKEKLSSTPESLELILPPDGSHGTGHPNHRPGPR